MSIVKNTARLLSVNWIKSILVNLYYFPFAKAVRLPILFGWGVRIGALGKPGCVDVPNKFGSICFALKKGPFTLGNNLSYWYIGKDSKLKVCGSCRISKGSTVKVFDGAELSFGDKFSSNADMIISCASKIIFGDDCLLGWKVSIMDNDGGHQIYANNKLINQARPIIIGDHVWIGMESTILKGANIASGCVVGCKSNVCGLISNQSNSVIIGNPAIEKKNNIIWEH
jgi:Acetyltransferase (isoleucine patch superfamily)